MSRGYEVPVTVCLLFEVEKELQHTYGRSLWESMGLSFLTRYEQVLEDQSYWCTPLDAVIFARTGSNGDHFVFLTGEGEIENLEEAPIAFIQPMDFDKPIKLIARNIREFLSMYITIKELYVFERFSYFDNRDAFDHDYREHYLPRILEREEEIEAFTTENFLNMCQSQMNIRMTRLPFGGLVLLPGK